MGQPQRNWYHDGSLDVIKPSLRLVPVIRTSSTPPASRSTGWIRADLVRTDEWYPAPEETREFHWHYFPEWHSQAKCREVPNPDDMFFGESDDCAKASMTITQLKKVKAFCKSCPVFTECLTHSLSTPERHGVWAGTSKRTRLRILALLDLGEVTIAEVVLDYQSGREKKYESIRKPRP